MTRLIVSIALITAAATAAVDARQVAAPAPNLAYEKPALEALARPKPPTEFPIEVNPLRVPTPGHPGLTAVFVRVPGGGLLSAGDRKTGTFTAGAAVLARFVDSSGAVVTKESQEFPIHGLMADALAILGKPIEFLRLLDLLPGGYRLQVAVYDQGGKQASVVTMPFEAPASTTPVVGDLMVVDHTDRLAPGQPEDPSNPFIINHVLLHPAFDAGVNRGIQPDVNFMLPIVVTPGEPLPPVRLALLGLNGEPLAAVPLPLNAPDAAGKLMTIGRIPLAHVPPGKYQLQVSVGIWPDARVRKTSLTVVD